jgi:hypothetical protein
MQVQKPLAVLRAEHAGQHAAGSTAGGLAGGEEEQQEMRDEDVLDAIMSYQVGLKPVVRDSGADV